MRTEHDVAREQDVPLWWAVTFWPLVIAACVMGLWSRFGGGRS